VELEHTLKAPHLQLRTAVEDDAEFVLSLRLDPGLSRFIGETDPSVEKQRDWIAHKRKEKDDYHMIVEGNNGNSLGVVAVYNIDWTQSTFEWGRWILHPDSPKSTANESALLCYKLGFDILGIQKSVFGVIAENAKVRSFHMKLGARLLHEKEGDEWFYFTPEDFEKAKQRFRRYYTA